MLQGTADLKRENRPIRTYSGDLELVIKRRRHIAKASVRLFAKNGYQNVTMRDISQASNMAIGTLYHYIGTKKDILHLIGHACADWPTLYRTYASTIGQTSKPELLHKCMAYYIKHIDSQSDFVIFLNREFTRFSDYDRNRFFNSLNEIESFFRNVLEEGIEAKEFQIRNPGLVAHNILMYGQDWVLSTWLLNGRISVEEYIEEQFRMLLDTIAVKVSLS